KTTLGGTGTLTNGGTLNLNGGTINALLVNQGLLMALGGTAINGSFANAAGSTLWVQGGGGGYGDARLTVTTSFTNAGTIRLESVGSTFDSTLTVGGGNVLTNAAGGTLLVNPGSGGNRSLTGNVTNLGTVSVSPGASLQVNGSHPTFNQSGGPLAGAGFFSLRYGTFNFTGGALNGNVDALNCLVNVGAGVTTPSTLVVSGAGSTLAGNLSPAVTLWVQGSGFGQDATLTALAGAANAGTIHLESIDSTWSSLLVTGGATLTNLAGGVISVSRGTGGMRNVTGTLANQGLVSVDANAGLGIGGTYIEAGGSVSGPAFIVNALVKVTASPAAPATLVLVGNSTLAGDNLANVTLWVQGGGGGYGDATFAAAGSFTNARAIRLESVGSGWQETLTVGGGGVLTNAAGGTLLVNPGSGGNRSLTGNVTNLGTVSVSPGASLQVNGSNPTFNQSGGTLAGAG